jgi:hypothetical protein
LEIFGFNEEEENSDFENDEDNHSKPEGNDDPELAVDDDLTLANIQDLKPEDSNDNYTSDLCRQALAKVSLFFFFYLIIY